MKSKKLVLHALLIAIIYVVIVAICVPTSFGYINFGDALMMVLATILPLKSAILICGISAGLADITMGYYQYFIFSIFIKSVLVIIVSRCKLNYFLRFSIASFVSVILYGIADCLIFSSLGYFGASIGFNLIQAVVCVLAASFILKYNSTFKHVLNYLEKEFK